MASEDNVEKLLTEEEILDFLIYEKVCKFENPYLFNEKSKQFLYNNEYFKDKDCLNFTDKANELITNYYQSYRKNVITALSRLQNLGKLPTTKEIVSEKANIKCDPCYIKLFMKKLEIEGLISISVTTDFDKRIKYIITQPCY